MFRDSESTYDTVKPYLRRALQDDDVRRSMGRAFGAARKVYGEVSGKDPVDIARAFSSKDKVRDGVDTTVQSLSEAVLRLGGKKPRRRSWKPFLLAAIIAIVLFNPVTGEATRTWIKDHLFGSEEEFDYGPPTV